jgi:hypothetical protein
MKFYHASPKRFRYGDILVGGLSGGSGYGHLNVCLTTTPVPHPTIQSHIPGWKGHYWGGGESPYLEKPVIDRDWFVYEVEPIGPVHYVAGNDEYQAKRAKVLKNLGKAKSFLQRLDPNKPSGNIAYPPEVEYRREQTKLHRRERYLRKLDEKDEDREASAVRVANRVSTPVLQGLDGLSTYNEVIRYLRGFPGVSRLGTGKSREVYDIGGGKVLKITLPNALVPTSNRTEVGISECSPGSKVLTRVLLYSDDFSWLVMEKAEMVPLSPQEFRDHLNRCLGLPRALILERPFGDTLFDFLLGLVAYSLSFV